MNETAGANPGSETEPKLKIDGNDKPELDQAVLSLSIFENTEGLYRCELELGNKFEITGNDMEFSYFDREQIDFGAELSVSMGEGEAAGTVFAGQVTAIEGRFPRSPQQTPPSVLFLAEDRLQDLRMTRRSRHFEDVSVEDVVNAIASDHGLQAQVDIDSPDYSVLTQVNQSDLAFLRDCGRAIDAELWLEAGKIYMQSRSLRDEQALELKYGSRLAEFSVIADLAQQCTSLRVSGWDVDAKEALQHEAADSALGSELGGDSGGSLLQRYFGERAEQHVHHAPQSLQQTRAMAEAFYRQRARRFLTGYGVVADGDSRLRVGYKVQLEGLGPMFSGLYYLSEVTHRFDRNNGYRTFFLAEKPGLGGN